jgi:hypothetical protein
MGVELSVAFEGTEPGLAEHRLSMSAFGEPLRLLLIALQRTASAILSSAESPEYGSKGGQYKAEARMLDLELSAVTSGSAGAVFACTARVPPGGQLTITEAAPEAFERYDLPALAAARLLQDIDAERSGTPRNAAVRRYLASIPPGVTMQRYRATSGVEVLGEIAFESIKLTSAPDDVPRLQRFEGRVGSVSFDPSSPHVLLRSAARSVRCSATRQQIDRALAIRGHDIVAVILHGRREPRLIWIRTAAEAALTPPLERTVEHLRSDWGETLRELAR